MLIGSIRPDGLLSTLLSVCVYTFGSMLGDLLVLDFEAIEINKKKCLDTTEFFLWGSIDRIPINCAI